MILSRNDAYFSAFNRLTVASSILTSILVLSRPLDIAIFPETESDRPACSLNTVLLGRLRVTVEISPKGVFDTDTNVPDLDISLLPFSGTLVVDLNFTSDLAAPHLCRIVSTVST